MAKPMKFRINRPLLRIANRCLSCGKIIPNTRLMCISCAIKIRRGR